MSFILCWFIHLLQENLSHLSAICWVCRHFGDIKISISQYKIQNEGDMFIFKELWLLKHTAIRTQKVLRVIKRHITRAIIERIAYGKIIASFRDHLQPEFQLLLWFEQKDKKKERKRKTWTKKWRLKIAHNVQRYYN